MKSDVLLLASLKRGKKKVTKETLNHPGLIEYVTGLDPFANTPEAYLRAYKALGIDFINRVPMESAPAPLKLGETRVMEGGAYQEAYLGLYNTAARVDYPVKDVDDVWDFNMEDVRYEDLITPVGDPFGRQEIERRMVALGDVGCYYYMLYTTLFMWGVEVLGWEVYLQAIALYAERFDRHFLEPCFEKSLRIIETLSEIDTPYVWVHDDLASANGPMHRPEWYREYIFPRYPALWEPAKRRGKKLIFVADGNMEAFLDDLLESGVDGFMFENPATRLEAVMERFGEDKIFIGGVETNVLTSGTPEEVKRMVYDLAELTRDCPGFVMASCGGLNGNIPLENLIAYFDARAETGFTPVDWREIGRTSG